VIAALYAVAQQGGVWIDVPFVKQPEEGCGAASIAMVMQYWQQHQGQPETPSSDVNLIQRALFSKQARGIYASDLERYLNQQGFRTYIFRGDRALLMHHLQQGRPLIVALKPASGSLLHYVVVTGIDPERQTLLTNDPSQRKLLKVDSSNFDKEGQATSNWTLLAVPRSDAH
jgi:ABC-type bacteriocin/lantibiotic exporter with double-glycine peptidase domain